MPIEAAVLDRLGEVQRGDLVLARQVGDRARHAEDAGVGPRGESEAVAGGLEEPATGRADAAQTANLASGDVRVERHGTGGEAAPLTGARRSDARPHDNRCLLAGRLVMQDRALHLAVEQLQPGDRTVQVVWSGTVTGFSQLDPQVRDAILGNAGTIISFRTGSEDAEILAKEFYPEIDTADLVNLPNYTVYVKLMVGGTVSRPFSAGVLPPYN